MQVAVSFSGLPRLLTQALYSWKVLINNYNADVFMHLWDTDDGQAEKLVEIFKPVKYVIEPVKLFDVSAYTERLQYSNPLNVLSMWTSLSASIDLVLSHDRHYDIIVRARSDVEFDQFQFLNSHGVVIPGKPAEVYEYQGLRYPGWHDMIAYGDSNSMRTYADTLLAIPKIYAEGSPFFSEFFLSTHLFRTNTNTTHHATFANIIR
jgi:hypothetical protein